jgi:hypothetical protein
MTKLSDTQLVLLSNAAKRDDGALTRPAKAHPPALANAIKQLLARALVRKTAAGASMPAWGEDDDGSRYSLCITSAGLDAIGVDESTQRKPLTTGSQAAPTSGQPVAEAEPHEAAKSPQKRGKRTSVVQASGSEANGIASPSTKGRGRASAGKDASSQLDPHRRPGSKLATVVAMLRAPEGASITAIMTATDWQAHSVRGAIAGAIKKKLGLAVISERRGEERIYRIAG